mgnify:CR=1 FL=1
MALKKCPKCELNYIRGDAPYCDICMGEMRRAVSKGKPEEEELEAMLCAECGEANAVPGFELCPECLKEQKRQQELENAVDLDMDLAEVPESEEEEE